MKRIFSVTGYLPLLCIIAVLVKKAVGNQDSIAAIGAGVLTGLLVLVVLVNWKKKWFVKRRPSE